ncbi:MAG: dTMP kinase [Candidatus Pacebacteria bacterium]|nr:dTMP kinase [Candidatus Paceibacterota bacterium]
MFITFEGGEGSGKSTQIKNLTQYLRDIGYNIVVTREPGGTFIGNQIRRVLKSTDNTDLVPEAELLLFVADRIQHIKQVIKPTLTRGDIVLCDRYFDSTFAYQGVARSLDEVFVKKLHQMFEIPIPDLTLLFDLPPSIGLYRVQLQLDNEERDSAQNRFEEEDFSFQEKLRQGYLSLARKESRFCIIKAINLEDIVWQFVKKAVNNALKLN